MEFIAHFLNRKKPTSKISKSVNRELNRKKSNERAEKFVEFLYRTEFEVPVPASVESSIVSDASEPLSYNWGAPYHIAQEINDNDVGNISGKISEKSTRKVFVFQPEELDRTRFRNIYERLDEAKKLAFTIPGLTITSFGIYPVNISEDFDEFLPIYDDKDWQIRLKNDVIWDETDIFFINVARLSPSHYLNLAWLLNEGYIPESEQVLTSLAFEKLKVQIWDRERMLLEVFRYRSIEDTLPTDIISEMHLKRLDSVDVRVTDEEADCRRVYSNHFKHKAEQRGQSERRVAHEMRKKLYHDVRCGFLHTDKKQNVLQTFPWIKILSKFII